MINCRECDHSIWCHELDVCDTCGCTRGTKAIVSDAWAWCLENETVTRETRRKDKSYVLVYKGKPTGAEAWPPKFGKPPFVSIPTTDPARFKRAVVIHPPLPAAPQEQPRKAPSGPSERLQTLRLVRWDPHLYAKEIQSWITHLRGIF